MAINDTLGMRSVASTSASGKRPTLHLPNKVVEEGDWHYGKGVIRYDPPRPGMKRRTDWWCIVDIDREITRYYRWWVMKEKWIDLKQPSWDAHISVIRGEKPKPQLMHLWNKYEGKTVEFRYKHEVRQSGDTTNGDRPDYYWFVEAECEWATNIRKELERPFEWKHHITIGRTY